MNTVTIDSETYQGAVEYAERNNMSVKEVVEHGIQLVIGSINGMVSEQNKPKAKDGHKQYSSRIMHLRSLRGSGISPEEIEQDERLAYLLNR